MSASFNGKGGLYWQPRLGPVQMPSGTGSTTSLTAVNQHPIHPTLLGTPIPLTSQRTMIPANSDKDWSILGENMQDPTVPLFLNDGKGYEKWNRRTWIRLSTNALSVGCVLRVQQCGFHDQCLDIWSCAHTHQILSDLNLDGTPNNEQTRWVTVEAQLLVEQ